MWNLECVGNHGIPFEAYRQDESEGADLVVKDGILNVLGGIDFGFYDRFKTVIDAHPEITIISLGSGGGSVADALQAGQLIRERGLKTQLYGKCFFACPMVFAGGVDRVIYWPSKAALGFHQIYTDDGPAAMTSEVYDVLRAYLDEMGVDVDTFIGLMTRAGPEDMYEPDVGDLCKPHIATWVQRTCSAENP